MPDSWSDAGWARLSANDALADWVAHVAPRARRIVETCTDRSQWRSGGTWFAGANLLPNDGSGALAGGPPLTPGIALALDRLGLPALPLDRGQISVCRPGYPQRDPGESDAALRFRTHRAAAHVDGLLPIGTGRARMLREPHAYILGLPLSDHDRDASPLVVWEGSHRIMADALFGVLGKVPPADWPMTDLTPVYHAARRRCFETCRRLEIHARPGEGYVLHRLALHGVRTWDAGARAPQEGRTIVYFRPELTDITEWPVCEGNGAWPSSA